MERGSRRSIGSGSQNQAIGNGAGHGYCPRLRLEDKAAKGSGGGCDGEQVFGTRALEEFEGEWRSGLLNPINITWSIGRLD